MLRIEGKLQLSQYGVFMSDSYFIAGRDQRNRLIEIWITPSLNLENCTAKRLLYIANRDEEEKSPYLANKPVEEKLEFEEFLSFK